MSDTRALDALRSLPSVALGSSPSPLEEMSRLRTALGRGPRLLVKRDDAIPFGFGGNKVRKMRLVAAQALAENATTLVTCGGVQSNHARATAATAAKLGLRCVLVANGAPPERPTANALLDRLLGAEVEYVATRDERDAALGAVAARETAAGRRPFVIPLGASIPLGAAAFALAIDELLAQMAAPDLIVHASSSGGTQAGLIAGCVLHGLKTRVLGISADEPHASLEKTIRGLLTGLETLLGCDRGRLADAPVEVDDSFVGEGYGIASQASRESAELFARNEALFVDHTYTAKAAAGFAAAARSGTWRADSTQLFWHTGGQVGLFA